MRQRQPIEGSIQFHADGDATTVVTNHVKPISGWHLLLTHLATVPGFW